MSTFNAAKQTAAWSHPPVGGANTSTQDIASYPISWYDENISKLYKKHYQDQPSSWENRYRKFLKLDDTYEKTIMDFGCGFGLDALSYSELGNKVILSDIVPNNLIVATNVLLSSGYWPKAVALAMVEAPYFPSQPIDIFHSSGVLHHTPHIREILQRAVDDLTVNGEIRLMLYTDYLWRIATNTEPGPVDQEVKHHPMFDHYVRFCDSVGHYADWYSKEKLEYRVGDFLDITFFDYLREDKGYCVCHLKPKSKPDERA